MSATYITHRRDEKKVHDILFKKLKSITHSKFLGPDESIRLNYICTKQNVDMAKDRVSIMALVFTIGNSRIS
jgi:hypothetical protein